MSCQRGTRTISAGLCCKGSSFFFWRCIWVVVLSPDVKWDQDIPGECAAKFNRRRWTRNVSSSRSSTSSSAFEVARRGEGGAAPTTVFCSHTHDNRKYFPFFPAILRFNLKLPPTPTITESVFIFPVILRFNLKPPPSRAPTLPPTHPPSCS